MGTRMYLGTMFLPTAHQSMALLCPAPVIISWNQVPVRTSGKGYMYKILCCTIRLSLRERRGADYMQEPNFMLMYFLSYPLFQDQTFYI